MKRVTIFNLYRLFLAALLAYTSWVGATVQAAGESSQNPVQVQVGSISAQWSKHLSADRSFSFYYPTGWVVTETNSMVEIRGSHADEQLIMSGVPFSASKSPTELATGFISLLRCGNPNISASSWQHGAKPDETEVVFELSDKVDGTEYRGIGVVIKGTSAATWYSYIAPMAMYSHGRGAAILEGFINSVAPRTESRMPTVVYPSAANSRIDANARAFLFVLEFALGSPLTLEQEGFVLGEVKRGWQQLPEADLAQYDQYPAIAKAILQMGQKDLDSLRVELERTVKEWITESDGARGVDDTVKVIKAQLDARGRIMVPGSPPLTSMALTAYSELVAYSRLLREDTAAQPDAVSGLEVEAIKAQVTDAWKNLSKSEREGIATCPGLWLCMRVILREGTQAEKDRIRGEVRALSGKVNAAPSSTKPSSSDTAKPMDPLAHWSLMQIQQMTFNTYMWSRGFNYSPSFGKMW